MEQDLSWSIAQTGLPLITIELTTDDGKKGNLCLGCGSMIGFEGKEHKTQYVGITFQLEGKEYSGVFSVIEEYKGMKHIENESGIQVHGVLGMPFLTANNWIVDLDKLIVTSK